MQMDANRRWMICAQYSTIATPNTLEADADGPS